ncbi:MAG: ATP-grasp domain-containing protein [Planctomycetes bacterium]|nr:ATP-grasp domain-containing protein [Planctomycetota bacterium]
MKVLFLSPGYPPEMPFFVRGLAAAGAEVVGVGDSPAEALPPMAREGLSGYLRLGHLWDEERTAAAVRGWAGARGVERVECLWEPGMFLAARLREALGVPGMTVAETVPFRDKESMKQVLDAAGIRTPRHARARTEAEIRAAAERTGWPLVVKPIAGAGSADTHRADGPADLERVLPLVRHVEEVSVEEFIDGEEYTFDTICSGGKVLYFNHSWYRPRPLLARTREWESPQTLALRDVDAPRLLPGRAMGMKVLEALRFRDGFTHMEWFLKADGEAVFGEIGGRPPGARSTDIMNFACDFDSWAAWGEAAVKGRIDQPIRRRYNAAIICKRASGQGRIRRIEGLDRILSSFGEWVVAVELLPVGAERRDWRKTLLSDGWVMVRHPDLGATMEMADRVGTDLRLVAG